MARWMKYCLMLSMFITAMPAVYAGVIDSLYTKEAVQKFLVIALGKKGIIYMTECAELYYPGIILVYNPTHPSKDDTVEVVDPVTNSIIIKQFRMIQMRIRRIMKGWMLNLNYTRGIGCLIQ